MVTVENDTSIGSILHATALMFVAYSGYARITTMGEEVRKPQQTIPKAIIFTLVLIMLLYVAVAVIFVGVGGVDKLSLETTGNTAPWVGINYRQFNLAGDRPTAREKVTL